MVGRVGSWDSNSLILTDSCTLGLTWRLFPSKFPIIASGIQVICFLFNLDVPNVSSQLEVQCAAGSD